MMTKLPITVLVQTKNEEIGIAECLAGLSGFDQVIVVDSLSDDRTAAIAEAGGFQVVQFAWNGHYPKKKQWQLDNVETRNRWVLFIDADETPSQELVSELETMVETGEFDSFSAFDIPLEYVFAGRTLRHGHKVVKRALLKRDQCSFPVIDDLAAPGMGELEGHYQPLSGGRTKVLSGRIKHDDKDPVRTWFDRHNRYSDWEAYLRSRPELQKAAAVRRSVQGRVFDRVPFKPLAFFVFSYFLRQGFRDGRAGFDYAFALSAYYWQISLKVREARNWGGSNGPN